MWRYSKERLHRGARVVAIVLACHFVAGLLMAASPKLHKYLHHDFDAAEHICFATIMATGGCDAPGVALAVVAHTPDIFPCDFQPETCWVESVFQAGAVFEHAPPVLLS